MAARTDEGSTGSSTSSGEEDKKFTSQDDESKELRTQFERLRRQSRDAGQDGSSGPVRKERGVEEDRSMDVVDEADSRKKSDEQRKRLQRQLREIENSTMCAGSSKWHQREFATATTGS